MDCKCKICRKNLGELVNDMYLANSPISSIIKTLDKEECETNEDTIKRHLRKFNLLNNSDDFEIVDLNPTLSYDLNTISFERYDFDSESPNEAVAYLQKVHLYIYFKQLEIVTREQDEFYQGIRDTPPSQSITRLKQLYELLDKFTGVSIYVNQQAAIKRIELMGYTLNPVGGENVIDRDVDVNSLINSLLNSGDENKVIKGLEIKRRWLETESKLKDKASISEDEFNTNVDELSTIISRFVPAENVAELMFQLNQLNNKSGE
jgi:hypothetical protein